MRFKKGQIVEILFYDHSSRASGPLKFKVWGRVTKVDKLDINVQSWGHPEGVEEDNQTEEFNIIRSCIIRASELVRV